MGPQPSCQWPCQLTTMMKNPDTHGPFTAKLLPTEQSMLTAPTQSQQLPVLPLSSPPQPLSPPPLSSTKPQSPCQLATMMKNPDTPGLLTAKLLLTEQSMLIAPTQSQQLS